MKITVGKKKKNGCLWRKKVMRFFQSIFRVGVCALHTLGRHVVKHGFWEKGKFAIAEREKNEIRDFYLLGSYSLVGRHVVKHG